jgi:hypothetical protein
VFLASFYLPAAVVVAAPTGKGVYSGVWSFNEADALFRCARKS